MILQFIGCGARPAAFRLRRSAGRRLLPPAPFPPFPPKVREECGDVASSVKEVVKLSAGLPRPMRAAPRVPKVSAPSPSIVVFAERPGIEAQRRSPPVRKQKLHAIVTSVLPHGFNSDLFAAAQDVERTDDDLRRVHPRYPPSFFARPMRPCVVPLFVREALRKSIEEKMKIVNANRPTKKSRQNRDSFE